MVFAFAGDSTMTKGFPERVEEGLEVEVELATVRPLFHVLHCTCQRSTTIHVVLGEIFDHEEPPNPRILRLFRVELAWSTRLDTTFVISETNL